MRCFQVNWPPHEGDGIDYFYEACFNFSLFSSIKETVGGPAGN